MHDFIIRKKDNFLHKFQIDSANNRETIARYVYMYYPYQSYITYHMLLCTALCPLHPGLARPASRYIGNKYS